MKTLLWILPLLLIGVSHVHAAEQLPDAVLSGFESRHLDSRDELNPHNPGIGIRFADGYALGAYYNSINRESVYLGREWQWRLVGNTDASLNVGAVAGIVSGYKGGLHPLLVPEVVATFRRLEAALILVPHTTETPATFSLQLRWHFR